MPKKKITTIKKKIKKVKKEKKIAPKKAKKEVKVRPSIVKEEKYWEAVGRRKTAVARIRLFTRGGKTILINNKPYNIYFPILELQQIIQAPLEKMKCADKFHISAIIKGGGLHAQAEAVRHGISRVLTLFNPDFRKRLKRAGYLTRDSRMRERKKFGLKRARRAPQWQKR
jgi:small subunit ribosomal protein S9